MRAEQDVNRPGWGNQASRTTSVGKTALNLFPALLSADSADVGVGLWESREATDKLRDAHPGLRTWRDVSDGSRLFAWYADSGADLPSGFKPVTVRLDEAPSIFKRMVTDAVDGRFAELGFTRKGGGWANYDKASLLGSVKALEAAELEPIGIYGKVMPRVHYTRDTAGKLVIGLLLDVLYTTRLDVPVSEWLAAGLRDEVLGSYVVLLADAPEAKNWPQYIGRTLGKVDMVRDGALRLTDCRDNNLTEVAHASVTLEPTRANLTAYLHARHARAWEAGEKQLKQKIDEMVRPLRRSQYAEKAAERLVAGLGAGLRVHGALTARCCCRTLTTRS